jgi:hypothetical protein
MKRVALFLATMVVLSTCPTLYALYEVADSGTWPKTWPKELEPLRKQSRTLVGPMVEQPHYEIPFTRRDDFAAAWPHLLTVKSKGTPIVLVRGPNARLGSEIKAGVRIHGPAPLSAGTPVPEQPLPGDAGNWRERWMYSTVIELIVDGDIVDLNRTPLPSDTPIIDERFKPAQP